MLKFFIIIFLPLLLYSEESRSIKTLEPSKEKNFAIPIAEHEVLQDLNTFFPRHNRYEFSLTASSEKEKGVFSKAGFSKENYLTSTVIDSSFYYLLSGYLQPGIGINYQKSSGFELYSIRFRILTNIKNIFTEKFVPYILLGVGHMVFEFDEAVEGGSAIIFPELIFGIRYFLVSNIALNIGYGWERKVINSMASSKNGLNIGFSLFF